MNILVTGANGQLGRCIKDQVIAQEAKNTYIYTDVAGEDVEYLDLLDEAEVEKFVKERNIGVIINCAAYTNVDKAENDYEMAEALNGIAPRTLAKAALSVGAKLIHISTDYVFLGRTFLPYDEERITIPATVYGKTKLMGEEYIKESGCHYLIFRTAWLYSEYGNNFVKTMINLFENKDEINVVNDQFGTPTYAGCLAELIVKIIEDTPMTQEGIYHFTDEGAASWYDFANVIHEYWSRKTNGHCKINGVTTKEYGSKTKRPLFSVLDKTKLKTDFKEVYNPRFWQYGVSNVVSKLVK